LQKTVSHVRDSLASLLIHPHQTPAKSRSAFIAEATEKCAIKELLPRPSRVSQSRALSLAEPHPLPYHLCMPVYEHFVIRGRGYIIECCEPLLAYSSGQRNTVYHTLQGRCSLLPTIKPQPCLGRNYFDASEHSGSRDLVQSFRC